MFWQQKTIWWSSLTLKFTGKLKNGRQLHRSHIKQESGAGTLNKEWGLSSSWTAKVKIERLLGSIDRQLHNTHFIHFRKLLRQVEHLRRGRITFFYSIAFIKTSITLYNYYVDSRTLTLCLRMILFCRDRSDTIAHTKLFENTFVITNLIFSWYPL